MAGNNQHQVQVNVDIGKLPWMKCICGSEKFIKVARLKHIPALLSGARQDLTWESPMFKCLNPQCGLEYDEAKSEHFLRHLKKEILKNKPDAKLEPGEPLQPFDHFRGGGKNE